MNPQEIVPRIATCKELAAYLLGVSLVCFCIFCAPDAVKNAPVIKTLPFKHEVK